MAGDRRFRGCGCTGPCDEKNRCVCVNAGRECAPGLCLGCHDTATDSEPFWVCRNMDLQVDHRKITFLAPSSTHGFGLFAGEDIAQGEYIVEYTGELIQDDEERHRSAIYGPLKTSYIYNGAENETGSELIDSYSYGNEARFINQHKVKENCGAENKIVRGRHRIKIIAKKNIKRGAELFLNYGEGYTILDSDCDTVMGEK